MIKTREQQIKAAYRAMRHGSTIICNGCRVWRVWPKQGHGHICWDNGSGPNQMAVNIESLRWVFRNVAHSERYEWEEEYN